MAERTLSPTTAPDHPPAAGRRRALALGAGAFAALGLTAGAAATVADAALPGVHPDAELVAIGEEAAPLIAEYERHTAAWFALPDDASREEIIRVSDLADPACKRLEELTDRAAELTATTFAGCVAKARLAQHQMRMFHRTDGELVFTSTEEELAWSLLEDLLSVRAGA